MYCERCREKHKWYEDVCPTCKGPLVPDPAGVAAEPDAPIVTVFVTADEGLLPLATLALDQAGIEYAVRKTGLSDVFGVSHPTPGFESTGLAASIQVLADDERRARDVLADLEQARPEPAVADIDATEAPIDEGRAASDRIELFEAETGLSVGTLSRPEFEWLAGKLVRESTDDRDYWINLPTIQMLEEQGAADGLLHVLRRALGTKTGVNVRWR